MKILGIGGFFHDLNFSYYDTDDTKSLISVEEERFSRIKGHSILSENYSTNFLALDYILESKQLTDQQIDTVVISDKVEPRCIEYFKSRFTLPKFIFIGHHMSHIFNVFSFYPEFSRDSDCVALDGFGDGYSGVLARANGGNIQVLDYLDQQSSLGLLYTAATQHLGLGSFGSEGKLQGLAPYGHYDERFSIMNMIEVAKNQIQFDDKLINSSLFDDQEFYAISTLSTNEYFSELIPKRFSDESLDDIHRNFARTVQEDIFNSILRLIDKSFDGSSRTLVVSGGLAQNSSLINRLYNLRQYEKIVTTTSCSDRGNSLGALAYFCHQNSIDLHAKTPFLGSTFGDDQISSELLSIASAARQLSSNKVIALMDGKSELGARALCNRSILASPEDPKMKDYINKNIKNRELFRPFAPVCLERNVHKYFNCSEHDKYMTRCCTVTELAKNKIPSAVHIDNTSRVQFVSEDESERLIYKLLDMLEKEYGIEVLINTSLNGNGQPIANSLEDASVMSKSMAIDILNNVNEAS